MTKGKKKRARAAKEAARPAASDTPLFDELVPLYRQYDYLGIADTNSRYRANYTELTIREINVMAAHEASDELRLLAAVAETDDTVAMLGLLDELTDPSLSEVRNYLTAMST